MLENKKPRTLPHENMKIKDFHTRVCATSGTNIGPLATPDGRGMRAVLIDALAIPYFCISTLHRYVRFFGSQQAGCIIYWLHLLFGKRKNPANGVFTGFFQLPE